MQLLASPKRFEHLFDGTPLATWNTECTIPAEIKVNSYNRSQRVVRKLYSQTDCLSRKKLYSWTDCPFSNHAHDNDGADEVQNRGTVQERTVKRTVAVH